MASSASIWLGNGGCGWLSRELRGSMALLLPAVVVPQLRLGSLGVLEDRGRFRLLLHNWLRRSLRRVGNSSDLHDVRPVGYRPWHLNTLLSCWS